MRTPASRPRRIAGAIVAAVLATGCAASGITPATSPAGPSVPSPAIAPAPLVTPEPATPARSAEPGSIEFLDAELLATNTTPWPVATISADGSICAVGTDERLRCWASGNTVPKESFAIVEVGQETSCGIRTDRTVDCWGSVDLHAPKGRFTALAVAQASACGIRTNGSVRCWWAHEDEDGNVSPATEDPHIPDGTYVDISVGPGGGWCALDDQGLVACWAEEGTPLPNVLGPFIGLGDGCGIRDTGEIECFGEASFEDVPPPELPTGPFVMMDGSRYRGCAMRERGALACWGVDGYESEGYTRLPTPPGTWADVSVGAPFACARRSDGYAVCWGSDNEAARAAPITIIDPAAFTTTGTVAVSWHAQPVFAPITSYDVEYTTGPWPVEEDENSPGPRWVRLLTGTAKTSTTIEAEDGASYCWRVRSHDADGIVSDWGSGYYCTTVPIDDRALRPTGPWSPVEGQGYHRGTALQAATRGASLLISNEYVFGMVILATTCGGCGTFVIRSRQEECWDDELESPPPARVCPPREEPIDLRGPRADSAVVFMGNAGQEGYGGPVELVVTSSGKPVIIDGVIFADTE